MLKGGGGGLSWWREVVEAWAGSEMWWRVELVVRVGGSLSWWQDVVEDWAGRVWWRRLELTVRGGGGLS